MEKCGRARQATDDSIIRRMCIASQITKATDTHSEYVILTLFPWQHWLGESALILLYTCTDSLEHVRGRAVNRAVCCQPFTSEELFRCQGTVCELVTGTCFYRYTTVFPCQYHSTNAAYTYLIPLSQTLYDRSK